MKILSQPGILADVPAQARFVTFSLASGGDPKGALARLAATPADPEVVLGLGTPLAAPRGLRAFPSGMGLFPASQGALWARFSHAEAGRRFDAARALGKLLGPGFVAEEEVDAFAYRGGRDLSGFEDGTENPKGRKAEEAAIARDGGSFVAVQRWVHDLGALERMSGAARDHVIGRRLKSNEEIDDAPPSAHVKRSAQESFDPPAFMVRRSMPYGGLREHGLYFVSFVENLDRFERVLRRMAGGEDGVVDALFSFSRAVTGAYYWCPPVRSGRLDLRALRK
jgi:putative iron-dependent peroxidase